MPNPEQQIDTQRWFTDRRPAIMIDPPCLLRHYVLRPFRRSDVVTITDTDARKDAEKQLLKRLNKFISCCFGDRLDTEGNSGPQVDPIPELTEDRFRTHIREGFIRFGSRTPAGAPRHFVDIRCEILIDIHTEYVAIEIRAFPRCSATQSEHQSGADDSTAHEATDSTNQISRVLKILDELKQGPHPSADVEPLGVSNDINNLEEAIREAHTKQLSLYDEFWDRTQFRIDDVMSFFNDGCSKCALFDKSCGTDVCGVPPPNTVLSPKEHTYGARLQIKSVFTGLILMPTSDPETISKPSSHPYIYPPSFGEPLLYTKKASVSEGHKSYFENAFFNNVRHVQYHALFFKKCLGFWPSNQISIRESNRHAGSAVMCGILDGLGIYGCSYSGPPIVATRTGEPVQDGEADTRSWSQVSFFVIYSGSSRNQMTRFVQRLLMCGQNRVFLHPDFVTFRHATLELRSLSERLDRETLGKTFTQKDLLKIRSEANAASQRVRGGIAYRVSRTRNYWRNLQGLISNIRSVRIVGWQTYDDYINRIYGPHVNKYEEAGQLLSELELKISRAEEAFETFEANQQTLIANRHAKAAKNLTRLAAIGLVGGMLSEVAVDYKNSVLICTLALLAVFPVFMMFKDYFSERAEHQNATDPNG